MAKALEQEMHNYFTQLNEAEKKSVIQMLKNFLKGKKDSPGRISIEQYNLELKEAEAEFEKGDYLSHEEFIKQLKKW